MISLRSKMAKSLLPAALALVALSVSANGQVSIDPQSLVCTRDSLMLGSARIPTCLYQGVSYLDSITFYASALCGNPCVVPSSTVPLSRSYGLNIGRYAGPCTYPVSFSFQGGFVNPSRQSPYVYIQLRASSQLSAPPTVVTTIDCDGFALTTGDGYDLPC
jgi:hypothetical protein